MKGKYRLKKDICARVGVTVFTTPVGTEIKVTQVDLSHSKVLIDFGDGLIDWFDKSWLSKYAEQV